MSHKNNKPFVYGNIEHKCYRDGKELLDPFFRTPEEPFNGELTRENMYEYLYNNGIIKDNTSNTGEIVSYYMKQEEFNRKMSDLEDKDCSYNIVYPKTIVDGRELITPMLKMPEQAFDGELKRNNVYKYLYDNNLIKDNTSNTNEIINGFIATESQKRQSYDIKNDEKTDIVDNVAECLSGCEELSIPINSPSELNPALSLTALKNANTTRSQLGNYVKQYKDNEIIDAAPAKNKGSKTNNKKTAMDLSEIILSSFKFVNTCGAVYFFENQYYKLLTKHEASSLLIQCGYSYIKEHGSSSFVNDLYQFMLVHPCKTIPKDYDTSRYLSFNNVVLDLHSGELFPNDGNFFITSKINCNYVAYDTDPATPIWDKYLNDLTGGDTDLMSLIMEVLGYYITSDMSAQKFVILLGGGATGKSVFGSFVAALFNEEAVAAIDIYSLNGRFEISSLVGKKINVAMDLPGGKISNEAASKLKMLTGEDICKAERKYEDAFFFRNTCKFLLSSNFQVITETHDVGFNRRMLIIPCIYTVPENQRDRNLLSKLLSEKEAIIFKALQYYYKLRARNYAFTPIDLDYYCSKLNAIEGITFKGNFKSMEDVLSEFINKCCVIAPDAKSHNATVFKAYKNYCALNSYIPYNTQQEFTAAMKELLGNTVEFKKLRINGDNLNGVIGLSLKTSDN